MYFSFLLGEQLLVYWKQLHCYISQDNIDIAIENAACEDLTHTAPGVARSIQFFPFLRN